MKYFPKMAALALVAGLSAYSSMTQAATAVEYGLLAGLFATPVIPSDGIIAANSCTNEAIKLSGEYDVKFMTDFDENDQILKLRGQILPKGTKGVGENSGATYHVVGASNLIYRASDPSAPTFPYRANIVSNLKIIGDNVRFTIQARLLLNVDADGNVRVEKVSYEGPQCSN